MFLEPQPCKRTRWSWSWPALVVGTLLRSQKGLPRERLAEMSGLSRSYTGGIERAERIPSIVSGEGLTKALGSSLAEMFTQLS